MHLQPLRPVQICALTSLEILDLGRNKLRILPPELANLSSLKVLSVQKNRIEDLPYCIADMSSLQVLKLDGNPIRFPPKEILEPQATSPPNGGFLKESEIYDVQVTSQIKKFLRQHRASQDRSETESGGEESSEGAETPKPLKRVMSGRFPIRVNGADGGDLRSPILPRPPPIPSRSHQRGLSQQNAALRRPGVMPLTIGNVNERMRSNSESLLQATRSSNERSDRSRRMGIVSRKTSELGTVDETKANRYSHLRGLSHGSALHTGNNISSSRSPASPADGSTLRPGYVRRLSSLPEKKRKSRSPDPIVEGAKGVLYALWQIHELVNTLVGLCRDDATNKRSSLERVFYNASTQVEELDRDIIAYDTYSEDDEEVAPRSNQTVHSACLACVSAYVHVSTLLSRNVDTLLANGEPRYIRSLLLAMYGGLAEIRNAGESLFINLALSPEQSGVPALQQNTLRPFVRDKSLTPTRDRPGVAVRSRSATVVQHSKGLRVATDAPQPSMMRANGRSATMTSATPRSGESFASSNTSGSKSIASGDFSEDDRIFERIYLGLQQSADMALRTVPIVNISFVKSMNISLKQGDPDHLKQYWQVLCQKCNATIQAAEALRTRLSQIKLKEPGIRTEKAFWELCNAFMTAYYNLVAKVKEVKPLTDLLTNDVIALLRPLQKAIRETGQMWHASPWSFSPNSVQGHGSSTYGNQSPSSQIPLPMTPASAALGPAVQATVPSTPQSGLYNSMFSGNVFERADALLSMTSGTASRTGTLTSSFGSSDGATTPSSLLSPGPSMHSSRLHGSNGKVNF